MWEKGTIRWVCIDRECESLYWPGACRGGEKEDRTGQRAAAVSAGAAWARLCLTVSREPWATQKYTDFCSEWFPCRKTTEVAERSADFRGCVMQPSRLALISSGHSKYMPWYTLHRIFYKRHSVRFYLFILQLQIVMKSLRGGELMSS